MGKENKQVIVLLVILLATVVLLDVGKTRLSGRQVDESTITMSEESPMEGPTSPDEPIVEPYCGVSSLTNALLTRIGAKQIEKIVEIQDPNHRYYVIFARDVGVMRRNMWVVYDVGSNGLIGDGDDGVVVGEDFQSLGGVFINETADSTMVTSGDENGKTKLFWLNKLETPGQITIKSCTLDTGCNDRRVELGLQASEYAVLAIVPRVARGASREDRLYLAVRDPQKYNAIVSCSLDTSAADSCGKGKSSLREHTRESFFDSISVLRDTGMIFNYDKLFNIITKTKTTIDPSIITKSITPALSGANAVAWKRSSSSYFTDVVSFDLISGKVGPIIDTLPISYYSLRRNGILVLDQGKNRIISIYGTWDNKNIYAKVLNQPQRVILNSGDPLAGDLVFIKNGQIITVTDQGVLLFDCTV